MRDWVEIEWRQQGPARDRTRRDIDQDRDDAALCTVVGMEYGRNNRGSEGAELGDTCTWCPGLVDFLHSLSRSRTGGVIIISRDGIWRMRGG